VSDRLAEFGGAAVVLITFTCPRNLRGIRRRLALTDRVLPTRPAPPTAPTAFGAPGGAGYEDDAR
jgi:hypothetical protein